MLSIAALTTLSTAPSVVRPCSRCSLPLTDPASIQAGLGPICRGMANKLLAKELPSAWSDADLTAIMFLGAETFEASEDQARYAAGFAKLCTSKGMNQATAATGEDLRALAKELVYLSSVAPSTAVYEALIGAIKGIGYPVYAAYVSGESSTGEAKVTYEAGRLVLVAVRNAAGSTALRRVGARFDSHYNGWTSAAYAERKMAALIEVYWPMVKGLREALEGLKADTAPTIHRHSTGVSFAVPYHAAFIEALKETVPAASRRYNPSDKAWMVTGTFAEVAIKLVVEHFGR